MIISETSQNATKNFKLPRTLWNFYPSLHNSRSFFSLIRYASLSLLFSRAQTNTDVFVLAKEDLDEVFTHSPQIRKKILKTAEERQKMVAKRVKAFTEENEEDDEEEENKQKVQNVLNCRNNCALLG